MSLIGFIDRDENEIPFAELPKGNFGIPITYLKSLAREKRKYADLTASMIAGLLRQNLLKERHNYFEKPDDGAFRLHGQSFHGIMENHADKNALSEERLTIQVDGIRVGGIPDEYFEETLRDWKTIGVYTAKMLLKNGVEKERPDWIVQLSIYRWLLESHGFPVKKCEVFCFVRDHRAYEAKRQKDYPPIFFTLPVRPISLEETNKLVAEAVSEWKRCQSIPDNELPKCPESQLWEKNGERLRCSTYCPCAKWCSQYAQWKASKAEEVA